MISLDSHDLKLLSTGLANAALVAGVIAAVLWWYASRVKIEAPWGGQFPTNPTQALIGWITAIDHALNESGRLNSLAAAASGVAVFASSLSGWILNQL